MKPDNPPAFPVSEEAARGKVAGVYGGMTLRDWFAGQALAGIRASALGQDWAYEKAAAESFKDADAMLAQRQKEEK